MATPLDGWEVDSFHGGSIIITSNILLAIFFCLSISTSQSKAVISAQIGIEFYPTWEDLTINNFKRYFCLLITLRETGSCRIIYGSSLCSGDAPILM